MAYSLNVSSISDETYCSQLETQSDIIESSEPVMAFPLQRNRMRALSVQQHRILRKIQYRLSGHCKGLRFMKHEQINKVMKYVAKQNSQNTEEQQLIETVTQQLQIVAQGGNKLDDFCSNTTSSLYKLADDTASIDNSYLLHPHIQAPDKDEYSKSYDIEDMLNEVHFKLTQMNFETVNNESENTEISLTANKRSSEEYEIPQYCTPKKVQKTLLLQAASLVNNSKNYFTNPIDQRNETETMTNVQLTVPQMQTQNLGLQLSYDNSENCTENISNNENSNDLYDSSQNLAKKLQTKKNSRHRATKNKASKKTQAKKQSKLANSKATVLQNSKSECAKPKNNTQANLADRSKSTLFANSSLCMPTTTLPNSNTKQRKDRKFRILSETEMKVEMNEVVNKIHAFQSNVLKLLEAKKEEIIARKASSLPLSLGTPTPKKKRNPFEIPSSSSDEEDETPNTMYELTEDEKIIIKVELEDLAKMHEARQKTNNVNQIRLSF